MAASPNPGGAPRRPVWTFAVLAIAAATAWPALAFQEPGGTPQTGILLLHTGRIVEGRISAGPMTYTVELPNGRMAVPVQLVLAHCADLQEAYQRLRENLPDKTAASHLLLARWCLSHKLLQPARDELRAALELEPQREETRLMLARVEELLNPVAEAAPPPRPRKKYDLTGLNSQPAETIGGLSREAALQFTRRVQSILVNNCGNSSCHGPSAASEFRLALIRSPQHAHRRLVEQNVTAVLRYVDFEQPSNSRLLTALYSQEHGGLGPKIFQGTRGSEQADEVRDWIELLAQDAAEKQHAAAEKVAGKKLPAPPAVGSQPTESPRGTVTPAAFEAPAETLPRRSAKSPQEVDAFDPQLFNRSRPGN